MIVVDSSVWIAVLRRQSTPQVAILRALPDPKQIVLTDLVLVELLQGARDERHAAVIQQELSHFRQVAASTLDLAPLAGRHYRYLRQLGFTVRSTIDLIIATYCIANGYQLLHQDRDYDLFERHCGLLIA